MREVSEETGRRLEIDRLGFIHENFFYSDDEKKKGKLIYEVSWFFYMKTPEDFEPVKKSINESGFTEYLVWADENSDVTFYPEFFRKELKNPVNQVKHILTDERSAI